MKEALRRRKLVVLYAKMTRHTQPLCGASCKDSRPYRCCEKIYCEEAIKYAKTRWGVALESTGHPTLPLMGENGCVAAPHLRPICTIHNCAINSLGFKPADPAWTKKYFRLRENIDHQESSSLDDIIEMRECSE